LHVQLRRIAARRGAERFAKHGDEAAGAVIAEVVIDPGFSAPLRADLMHVEAASLPGSGPQTASWFQGWRYSSPHIRVGVCRCHQRVCQPAYENPQLACWRVCCVAFAR